MKRFLSFFQKMIIIKKWFRSKLTKSKFIQFQRDVLYWIECWLDIVLVKELSLQLIYKTHEVIISFKIDILRKFKMKGDEFLGHNQDETWIRATVQKLHIFLPQYHKVKLKSKSKIIDIDRRDRVRNMDKFFEKNIKKQTWSLSQNRFKKNWTTGCHYKT